MNKILKILLWIIGSFIVLSLIFVFIVGPILKNQTKKHSPEKNITFTQKELELKVFYCSPSKKDRVIFGELIPYGEVWRTGANEASTFTTNKDLKIEGNILIKGTYTLWTIPDEETWQVIFSTKMYDWGVNFTDQKAAREEEFDALVIKVPVSKSLTIVENFSISFTETEPSIVMLFSWDNVVVPVQMNQ